MPAYNFRPLRCGQKANLKDVYLSIRNGSIKLSAGFVAAAKITEQGYRHIMADVDDDNYLLQLTLMTTEDRQDYLSREAYFNNIYDMGADGGGRKRRGSPHDGRIINCVSAYRNCKWLASVAREDNYKRRRYQPRLYSSALTPMPDCPTYHVRIIPGFVHSLPIEEMSAASPSLDEMGIYRYLGPEKKKMVATRQRVRRSRAQIADDERAGRVPPRARVVEKPTPYREVLYIGQGKFRDRHMRHMVEKDWQPEVFEWTPVKDSEFRRICESHHLEAYRSMHGRYPSHNKRGGGLL